MVQTKGFELGPVHLVHLTSWYDNTYVTISMSSVPLDNGPKQCIKMSHGWALLKSLSRFCLENAFIIIIFSLF